MHIRSSLSELSNLLWRERDVLELLLSRLGRDAEECEGFFRSISGLELHRAITAREVASELGISGDATLDELVAAAPPEWASILVGHRRALLALAREVRKRAPDAARFIDLNEAEGDHPVPTPAGPRTDVQRSMREFIG